MQASRKKETSNYGDRVPSFFALPGPQRFRLQSAEPMRALLLGLRYGKGSGTGRRDVFPAVHIALEPLFDETRGVKHHSTSPVGEGTVH